MAYKKCVVNVPTPGPAPGPIVINNECRDIVCPNKPVCEKPNKAYKFKREINSMYIEKRCCVTWKCKPCKICNKIQLEENAKRIKRRKRRKRKKKKCKNCKEKRVANGNGNV